MRLLTHYKLPEPIVLEDKKFIWLRILDNNYFCDLLRTLNDTVNLNIISDESFHLFEEEKEISLSSKGLMVIDYFNFDINTRKVKSELIKIVNNLIEHSSLDQNIEQINTSIIELMTSICLNLDLNIEFNHEFDIKDLLKLYDFRVKTKHNTTCEAIIEWIKVCIELLDIKYYFYVALETYLTFEELLELEKFASYNDVFIINLSSQNVTSTEINRIKNSLEYTLDKDQCVTIN